MTFPTFKNRSQKLERMDLGEYTPQEYALWAKEMRLVHGFLGERRAIRHSLIAEIRGNKSSEVSVLDVGAGTGELTARVARELDGRRAYVVGADSSEHAVNAIADKGIQGVQCDALQLPFADKSFDYVFSTLFLHHLRDDAAVKLIREMLRVSQRKIFVIDLERRPLAYIFYRAFGRLFFQPFTRDDGALSILRAFNPSELRNIAKLAEMKNIRIRRSHLNRLILSGTN